MLPDPNRLWPDVFFYDRYLRDCEVYAWLLIGDEEEAKYLAGDMFLVGVADIVREIWPVRAKSVEA